MINSLIHFFHKYQKFSLPLILFTAFIIRIVVIVSFPVAPTSDALEYHLLAQNLIAGKGYVLSEYSHANFPGTLYAYRPPAFPFILAGVYSITNNITAAQIFQAALEVLQCFLIYVLGVRLFSRRVGLVAALFWALYPASIIQSTLLMPEPSFGCLFLGSLTVIFSGSFPHNYRFVTVGILCGLAALTRPLFIAAPLILTIWMVWEKIPFWEIAWKNLIVTIVMALVIMPWVVRNINVLGMPTIVTNAGINLWIGNNEQANGGFRFYPENNPLLKVSNEAERDRTGARLAWNFITTHPMRFLSLIPRKISHLFSSDSPYIFQIAQPFYEDGVRTYNTIGVRRPLLTYL